MSNLQASIEYTMYEDDYEQGELEMVNSWYETITDTNKTDLLIKVLAATNQDKKSDLDDEQMNEYKHATEYHASYQSAINGSSYIHIDDIAAWKRGDKKLYSVHCHILVSQLTEAPAFL